MSCLRGGHRPSITGDFVLGHQGGLEGEEVGQGLRAGGVGHAAPIFVCINMVECRRVWGGPAKLVWVGVARPHVCVNMVKTQDGVKWARGPAWSGAACLYVSMWTNERQKGERAAHNESACARAWSDVPHQRAAGTGEERPSKQQKGASWVRSMALRLAGAWVNRGAHVGPRSKQRGAGCWGKQVVAWPSTRQQAKPLMGGRPCAAEEEACARAHVCQAPETEPHPHSTCIQSSRPFAHAHAHACTCTRMHMHTHTQTNKQTNKMHAL